MVYPMCLVEVSCGKHEAVVNSTVPAIYAAVPVLWFHVEHGRCPVKVRFTIDERTWLIEE